MSGSFTFANPPNTPSIVGLTPCSHKQSKSKLYNNILIGTNPRRYIQFVWISSEKKNAKPHQKQRQIYLPVGDAVAVPLGLLTRVTRVFPPHFVGSLKFTAIGIQASGVHTVDFPVREERERRKVRMSCWSSEFLRACATTKQRIWRNPMGQHTKDSKTGPNFLLCRVALFFSVEN